jgi:hypothetical protein
LTHGNPAPSSFATFGTPVGQWFDANVQTRFRTVATRDSGRWERLEN